MEEEGTWINLFFSGSRQNILNANEIEGQKFRPFCAEDDNWELGGRADISRVPDTNSIQVFWLRIKGRRKFVGKVFPCYSKRDAIIQLHRIGVLPSPENIGDAIYEFDRFYREARAYSHIDLFCPARERIYFPQYHGVITDIPQSRFSSGYYHKRAVVLEAIKPDLRSRRVLSEVVNHHPETFLAILETLSSKFCTTNTVLSLSSFEQEWYHSLLKDRIRRLDTLHRIGITHGDIRDIHFRLPNDIYDTVLYDFSESYTFSRKQPFRVCGGRLRPLSLISEGERERVLLHVLDRAASRDLRSHLIRFNRKASVAGIDSKHISSVDDALWKSLDKEEDLLELIILRVSYHPDEFSMPTLNSIFPFLEAVCPNSDLCWHIRRAYFASSKIHFKIYFGNPFKRFLDMAETLLSYLTTRNPNVYPFAKPQTSFTFSSDWDPVDSIREWTDFNYDTLHMRFRNELSRHVSPFDTAKNCEDGGFNNIFDERGLSDLICMSIMGPVSAVLPSSFITSGGRVTQHIGCIPDWGAGKDAARDQFGKAKALVLGDTKFNWSSMSAINVVQNMRNGFYEDSNLIDSVRPIEQVQHYGAVYGCRYVYIISDQELVVMQLHLAPAPFRTSPRPQRTRLPPSHQRVTSSSTISKQLTDISLDESSFRASIGLVEYKRIPWSATSGLTIKLALYCLVRLAAEDGSDLKTDYPRLTSQVESSGTQLLPSMVLPTSEPRIIIGTSSTVTSTLQTSNEAAAQFYDVTVQWNKARTGYVYQDNYGKWVFDDSTSNWKQIGNQIYKFQGAPPYARSSIPH
ncbi:hypothetical protein PEX2_094190 [Penicillium expansum]|uniref:Protein kinase domain-containing protein n=1 Tax=Penicillium expansum TaxID=27334 RepID=A0A0A2K2N1_PENEN|nr:hypothetical protein PEX2_094190 [Penicillium expansum]KGO61331.1 hypothetical protein PEX2_094190 [Penicillium expansum]